MSSTVPSRLVDSSLKMVLAHERQVNHGDRRGILGLYLFDPQVPEFQWLPVGIPKCTVRKIPEFIDPESRTMYGGIPAQNAVCLF